MKRRAIPSGLLWLVAASALIGLVSSDLLWAQSGSRQPVQSRGSASRGSTTTRGSDSRTAAKPGLDGFCPVCIIEMKKWVKGDPAVRATYDGKTYYFPGEKQKQMFLAAPAKYVPALGGDCAVCLVNMGKRVAGSVYHSALHEQRLYLFPNKEIQQEFVANHRKYGDADLTLGGECSVCRVEMGKGVAGKPQFAEIHKGLRYLFPSAEQQKMFAANPAKYEVKN